jgi:hypothetical protein
MWGSPGPDEIGSQHESFADSQKLTAESLAKRTYQIDIEKPGVRVSLLTAGFFIALTEPA